MARDSIFNTGLIEVARFAKQAFVDPSTAGGAGGDPSQGGGAPPPDPSAGGAAPPPDPSAGGGGAPPGPDISTMIQTAVQQAMASQGGGGMGGAPGAAGGPPKMKIDVNIEIMQMKKMLAKIVDALGIPVPAQDLAIDQNDVNQMSQQQAQGGTGAPPTSSISPVGPIQGATPGGAPSSGSDPAGGTKQSRWEPGRAYGDSGIGQLRDKAAALQHIMRLRQSA